MLSEPPTTDSEIVRAWLERALLVGAPKGLSAQGLADFCEVSAQAVYGWRRTGRITKSNLQRATEYFGHGPVFPAPQSTALVLREPTARYNRWPFNSVTEEQIASLSRVQLARLEAGMRQRLDEWAQDALERARLANQG